MADNIPSLPSLDELTKSGGYNKIFEKYKANPTKAFSELTIMTETDNPYGRSKNWRDLMYKLKTDIQPLVQESEIQKIYKPVKLSETYKTMLDKDPKKEYQKLFNMYTYEEMPIEKKQQIRNILGSARKYLIDKGDKPDEYTTERGFVSNALTFLGRVFTVPINLIAQPLTWIGKGINTGKWDIDVKTIPKTIWQADGWSEFLNELGQTPYLQSIIEKNARKIPLTKKEQDDWNAASGVVKWGGLVMDLFLDPVDLLSKTIGKLVFGGNAKLSRMGITKTADLAPLLKTNLAGMKRILQNVPDAKNVVGKIDDVFSAIPKKGFDFDNGFDILGESIKAMDGVKGIENANKYRKVYKDFTSLKKMADNIKPLTAIGTLREAGKKKIKNVFANFAEKSGLRKKFIKDMPQALPVDVAGKGLGDLELDPNEAAKISDNISSYFSGNLDETIGTLGKYRKEIFKKNKGVDKAVINKYITAIAENDINAIGKIQKSLAKQGKKIIVDNNIISSIQDATKEFLLSEVKWGAGNIPFGLPKSKHGEWTKLVDEYQELVLKNPQSPQLSAVENQIRGVIDSTYKSGTPIKKVFEDGESAYNYLAHVMTPKGRAYMNSLAKKKNVPLQTVIENAIKEGGEINPAELAKAISKQGAFKKKLVAGATGSQKARQWDMSIDGFNDWFRENKKIDFDMFETDPIKILAKRGQNAKASIHKHTFAKQINKFGLDIPPKDALGSDYVKLTREMMPGLPDVLSGKWYHKDVAGSIRNLFDMTTKRRVMDGVLEVFDDIQNIWKTSTLGLFLGTVARNYLGNAYNSLLVLPDVGVKSLKNYVSSMGDAFGFYAKKKFGLKTSKEIFGAQAGQIDELYDVFRQLGGESGRWSEIEQVLRTPLKEIEGLTGIAGKKSKEFVRRASKKITETIRKFPTAMANELGENVFRFGLFLDMYKRGLSPELAMRKVNEALFDYKDLTKFEHTLRRIIPFYTFSRKNIPLQIKKIYSAPSRAAVKSFTKAQKEDDSEGYIDQRQQADYLKDSPKVRSPKGWFDKDRPAYWLLENTLPIFDISKFIRTLDPEKGFSNTVNQIVSDMTPLLKVPIENFFEYSSRFKKKIKKSKYDTKEFLGMRMDPLVANTLSSIRILSTIDKFMPTGGQETGITLSKPDQYFLKGIMHYIGAAPVAYDWQFSRSINKSTFKKEVNGNMNQFKYDLKRLQEVAYNNQKKPTKKDVEYISGTAKKIMLDVINGNRKGLFTRKEMVQYMKRLMNMFLVFGEGK